MRETRRIVILLILAIAGVMPLSAQRVIMTHAVYVGNMDEDGDIPSDSLLIEGRVVESLAKRDLTKAFLIPIDSDGNPGDTIKARPDYEFVSINLQRTKAYVSFMAGRQDSTYVFEIGCPGYLSQTVTYKVERLGKRERKREMPMTVLERAPHELKELEVVASKVKFYHNGDTLVYNADAFQLPDGSMLDELIRQLPGVELNNKGEIKVNGETVETLLLNGKHFFSGDHKLMLENLGAYTVDKVNVYRGQTAVEKWVNDPNARKHLTMDVKLKKEYSMGYIMNAQAGAGTENRYMGNMFASWFSNSVNLSMVGNINNVGDNFGLHGAEDSWTPSQTSSGDSRYRTLGLNYDFEGNDFKRTAHGDFKYSGNRDFITNDRSGTTYYTDNNVYNYSYSRGLNKTMNLNTSHSVMFAFDRVNLSADVSGAYSSGNSVSSSLSASFREEQADITQEALETIYGDGSVAALAALINRNRNTGNGDSKNGKGSINTTTRYKVPGTSDVITLGLNGDYTFSKRNRWQDYAIDYGDRSKQSENRRQYSESPSNHNMTFGAVGSYTARIGKVSLDFTYNYDYSDNKDDLYLYELQQLADMGEYGILPSDYQSAFSPADSHMSKERSSTHSFSPQLRYELKCKGNNALSLFVTPKLSFANRHLDYWRDNRWYNIRHNSSLREAFSGNVQINFRPTTYMEEGNKNSFGYSFSVRPQLPSLMSLVDITDNSNPLYIREGNPDLKASYSYNHSISWSYSAKVMNSLNLMYNYTVNGMTQSSVYDMKTGITRTRAENINGNNQITLMDHLSWSFGKKKDFWLFAITSVSRMHYVDLMSTNGLEPVKNSADTWTLSENLELKWTINGKHSVSAKCSLNNNRTDSNREGFNKINAFNANYGLQGRFNLPFGLAISSDFTLYTRRGYGSKELDTTDALWNARASYITKNRKWVFMVNAYDLLFQLSNVYYSVSATGQSVTYTNSLPRYVMATVQFRFNHQPKQRQ